MGFYRKWCEYVKLVLIFFSFCLQVANAAKMNASAVLIYADSIGENTQLFGHVSEDI